MSASRLEGARERLAEALRTGQDTTPHRAALQKLEATERAAAEQAAQAQQEAAAQAASARRAAIEARVVTLIDQAQREVVAAIAQLRQD